MPPAIVDVRRAEDARDVVHRAVQALVEGKLVAFPTETVYGIAASALNPAAVANLSAVKGRDPSKPMTLAVKSADDAMDYVPAISKLGQRLARRCWPGPLTLVLPNDHPDSLVYQLPDEVRSRVAPNGSVGLRIPAHNLIIEVLRLLAGPLALSSANRAGEAEAVTAQQVVQQLGDAVDLVLDDGRCQFSQPSSVVRVDGNKFEMLRTGVVSDANLSRLASFMVLMVCTGNTCRSPMAELLCKKRIADRIGCSIDELEDHSFIVASAGIAAMAGGRPSPEAVDVMAGRQLDLRKHESQPLSVRLVRFADQILTMTQGHRAAILGQWPEAASRTEVLIPDGTDIADPIGGPMEVYQQCADQIDAALAQRVDSMCQEP